MEAIKLDKAPVNETCIICEEKKTSGIYICNQLICNSCQKEIVETEVEDIRYNYLVEKLKKLSLNINNKVAESSS